MLRKTVRRDPQPALLRKNVIPGNAMVIAITARPITDIGTVDGTMGMAICTAASEAAMAAHPDGPIGIDE